MNIYNLSSLIIIKIVETGVGNISESDVKQTAGSKNSIIVGFHVKTNADVMDLADRQSILIETFDIIYKLTEWVEEALRQRKPKTFVEESTGKAKIIRVFSKTKDKQVVGGKVKEGKLIQGKEVKLLRREHEIGRGTILELQKQKKRSY